MSLDGLGFVVEWNWKRTDWYWSGVDSDTRYLEKSELVFFSGGQTDKFRWSPVSKIISVCNFGLWHEKSDKVLLLIKKKTNKLTRF